MMAVGVALLVVGAIAFATALLWGWATTSLEVILALIVVIGAVLLGWDVARHNQERR
jgi:membrane protein implicated in regulation of membrane protease activity